LFSPDTTQLPYFWQAITAPDDFVSAVSITFNPQSWFDSYDMVRNCLSVTCGDRKPVKRLLAFHLCASLGMLHFLPFSALQKSTFHLCCQATCACTLQSDRVCCVLTLQELICKINLRLCCCLTLSCPAFQKVNFDLLSVCADAASPCLATHVLQNDMDSMEVP
jgi:hypothetical protein